MEVCEPVRCLGKDFKCGMSNVRSYHSVRLCLYIVMVILIDQMSQLKIRYTPCHFDFFSFGSKGLGSNLRNHLLVQYVLRVKGLSNSGALYYVC